MQTGNFYCALPLILLLAASLIGLGFIYIFRKDTAWRIFSTLQRAVRPQRTAEWERYSTFNGIVLLVFGLMWLASILYVLLR